MNTSMDARACTQPHAFHTGNQGAERRTRLVMWITLATMVVEIAAGWWFNSMALLADGWHMSSHALAIGLTSLAYWAARRYAHDARFAFGTWKIEILSSFASAMLLVCVALAMVYGSVERLLAPQDIHYMEAIAIAIIGLVVNLGCALILGHDDHDHGHGHGHDHDHGHSHAHHDHGPQHADLNMRSAYVHVLADAATSVLAIAALAGGMWMGWSWLDPVMGLVGATLVAVWAVGLLRDSGRVLLDREMDHPVTGEIRTAIADLGRTRRVTLADLHVWRIGKAQFACIVGLSTDDTTLDAAEVKRHLGQHEELVHVTVEINHPTSLPRPA